MKIIISLTCLYLFVLAAMYVFQRSLMYFPDTVRPEPVGDVEIVHTVTEDNHSLSAWYIPGKDTEKPTILLFHGNAGHFAHRIHKVVEYINAGYNILLAEYRGYGGNKGSMSEQGFYQDARAYLSWLDKEKKTSPEDIILYGESLGSGVAIQLATEHTFKAIILETPYHSVLGLAQKQYPYIPINLLLKDRYNSIDKIDQIKNTPILFLHGHKDSLIPISSAKKLFTAANEPKTFVDFEHGEHNNLYEFGASAAVLHFLSGLELQNKDNKSQNTPEE